MALSHAEVAQRFADARKGKGSALTVGAYDASNPGPTMHGHFRVVATAYSYATQIAHLVDNEITGKREMWRTPVRYSPTTDRHMRYLLGAYTRKYGYPTIYSFGRGDTRHLLERLARFNLDLPDVDKPRIHDATRRGVVDSLRAHLHNAMFQLTDGLPPHAYAWAHSELATGIEQEAMLTHWLTLPVDDMRTTVRAYLTLNEIGKYK
jgi:hypothetical protein